MGWHLVSAGAREEKNGVEGKVGWMTMLARGEGTSPRMDFCSGSLHSQRVQHLLPAEWLQMTRVSYATLQTHKLYCSYEPQ